jgi:hypothetical protein
MSSSRSESLPLSYACAILQPTDISSSSSEESSQPPTYQDDIEATQIVTTNDNNDGFLQTCMNCLECCAVILKICYCCCTFIENIQDFIFVFLPVKTFA